MCMGEAENSEGLMRAGNIFCVGRLMRIALDAARAWAVR